MDLVTKKITSPKGEAARERNATQYNIQTKFILYKKIEMLMLTLSNVTQLTLYNLENEPFRRDLHV